MTATAKARAAARAKGCPVMAVARPWQAAAASLLAYQRAGVDLEEAYRVVVDLDNRGETVALTPDYRARVGLVRTSWRLALGDVRDMRTELAAQLGARAARGPLPRGRPGRRRGASAGRPRRSRRAGR